MSLSSFNYRGFLVLIILSSAFSAMAISAPVNVKSASGLPLGWDYPGNQVINAGKTSLGSEGLSTASLYIDPPLTDKAYSDVGTNFELNETITDITDLQGFDFNLTWDNSLITLTNVDFTTTLNSIWGSGHWYDAENESSVGYYKLVALSTASSFNSTEPTPLCRLTFTAQDPQSDFARQTTIHFDTHKLSDSQANPIAHTVTDGSYSIAGREATVQITPSLIEKNSFDVSTTFEANVTVQSITDLYGFDFNITWDRALLAFNNCYYQDALDAVWGSGKWFLAKSELGPDSFKLVALSTANSFNTTQNQTLFTLEFRVENPPQPNETTIHFATHKLSNSQAEPITHFVEDGTYRFSKTPRLEMSPTGRTCRKVGESFDVAINVSDAYNVTDFEFEIHYNTTLLDFASVAWNAWGSGTVNVDETGGIINGSTSGMPIIGTEYLITVEFKASCYHVWKSFSGWTNDLADVIFIQSANVSYTAGPDLRYERGGLSQISVGSDFTYTFSPIQGDVNNDGTVDIYDLRTMAIYYMIKESDPNWQQASTYDLNGDGVVDIFDLRTAASNFGFTYIP